jgi:hypothetical protein
MASNGRHFTYFGFPNYLRASVTSLLRQQLTKSEPQLSSNSLIHQPSHCTLLTPRLTAISHQSLLFSLPSHDSILIAAGPRFKVSARTTQGTPLSTTLSCYVRVCYGHYLATTVVYRAVTLQQSLYSCLFRGRCLATGLHTTIYFYIKLY